LNIINVIIGLLILGLVLYAGAQMFIAMVETLWTMSPITAIGFVISVIVAIIKGHIRWDKLVDNLRILLFIFVGTAISYAATSLLPSLINSVSAGQFIGALITGAVIVIIWFRGQEIKAGKI
jgi:uncharacterized membrane protein